MSVCALPESSGNSQMRVIGIQREKISGRTSVEHLLEMACGLRDKVTGHRELSALIRRYEVLPTEKTSSFASQRI